MDKRYDPFSLHPVEVEGLNAALDALNIEAMLEAGLYNASGIATAYRVARRPVEGSSASNELTALGKQRTHEQQAVTALQDASPLTTIQVAICLGTSPTGVRSPQAARRVIGRLALELHQTDNLARTFCFAIYQAIARARDLDTYWSDADYAIDPMGDGAVVSLNASTVVRRAVLGDHAGLLGGLGIAPTNIGYHLDGLNQLVTNGKSHAGLQFSRMGRSIARRVSARALAVFYALDTLDLLDNDLLFQARSAFGGYASSKSGDASAGNTFAATASALAGLHSAAVAGNRLHTRPKAWSEPPTVPVPGIGDLDLHALILEHQKRVNLLNHCTVALRLTHLHIRDVKERPFFQAILGAVTGGDRLEFMRADATLASTLSVVHELIQRQLREAEHLSRALGKIEILQRDHAQRGEALERYERVVAQLAAQISRLRAENAALATALRDAETDARRARIGADILLGLQRLGKGPRQIGVGPVGASAEAEPDRTRIVLDLELAMAMGAGRDQTDLIERASKVGIAVPPREVIERTLDSLRLPIGAPEAAVYSAYRAHMVHFHPDRVLQQSAAQQRLAKEETARLNHARDLHKRYHELFGGEA